MDVALWSSPSVLYGPEDGAAEGAGFGGGGWHGYAVMVNDTAPLCWGNNESCLVRPIVGGLSMAAVSDLRVLGVVRL